MLLLQNNPVDEPRRSNSRATLTSAAQQTRSQDLANTRFLIRLCDAFLTLDDQDQAHAKILVSLDARAFVPATREDFNLIRQVVTGTAEYPRP